MQIIRFRDVGNLFLGRFIVQLSRRFAMFGFFVLPRGLRSQHTHTHTHTHTGTHTNVIVGFFLVKFCAIKTHLLVANLIEDEQGED